MRRLGDRPEPIEVVLAEYEGLVFTTARLLAGEVEGFDHDDIANVLRIKVWRAVRSFDPAKTKRRAGRKTIKQLRDAYVFMCLTDQVKDLKARKRRGVMLIDDLVTDESQAEAPGRWSRDRFESDYLSAQHDEVYGDVDEDDLQLPNTLTPLERQIVTMLYLDYRDPVQTDVAGRIGIGKRDMERCMRSIRTKLADWKPSRSVVEPTEACDLSRILEGQEERGSGAEAPDPA